ncbi:hypothetical protein A4X13_0g5133 [Tilletia indica]|uniref:ATP-dependent DNA helicase n=1 Tax=Tilletia indica TaxID=43049 RepID=A0A177TGQ2_9BASI|nr:hypothetical protein A4X13_0g5133 [Tilletia indica]
MRVVDELTPIVSDDLRSIIHHHFPRISTRRLNRQELVQMLLRKMAEEEVDLVRRFRRRSDTSEPTSLEVDFVRRKMEARYVDPVLQRYRESSVRRHHPPLIAFGYQPVPQLASDRQRPAEEEIFSEDDEDVTSAPSIPDWPQPIDASTVQERLQEFRQQTTLVIGPTCAVRSRRSFNKPLLYTDLGEPFQQVSANDLSEGLPLLEITDEHILARNDNHLSFEHPLLAGLALDKNGVHYRDGSPHLDICQDCHSSLTSSPPKLPALSLANSNIRGWLPPDLQDCTWLEERLCAKYLASAYIIRLYDVTSPGAPETRPRVMKGHACAFPLNTVSTAVKLPWTFSDAGPLLSCLVIGPRPPRQQDLQKVFTVRRQKVLDLLKFLRANFLDYPQFPIDDDALNQLPENDVPELLMRFVVHQQQGDVPSLFEEETSGLESHPGLSANDDLEAAEGRTFLEHHGLVDLNGVSVPGHARMVTGLASAAGFGNPDLLIKHGIDFIRDYDNPSMFPGMFPTLFPWGTGGFEQKREVPLAFKRQATHLLDIADPSFRRHWSYVFVVANIRHRRLIHLGSRLACKARDFEEVARELESLDVQTIRNVASHLGDGGCMRTLSAQEANVQRLLKKCELISVRVPGSKAAMNLARAEIRSYIGEHGIFQLFLTLNPNPLHSPVFQVFFGDTGVNLNLRVPMDLSAHERSLRVADDPIAASDYFHFHVSAVFRYLFGWDFKQKQSTPQGGLLGHLAAFYMVKEHTMRGQLHGHILIWLKGGMNPKPLREKLQQDAAFQERYLRFLDSVIQHHLPDADVISPQPRAETTRKPRQERPPDPTSEDFAQTFKADHRLLGEEVQRHKCTSTCFKGGRTSCRFLYPHDLSPATHFESDTNSIMLEVKDATINWHNPALLVATRHNHDLKSVQSGKSGVAAASYITSYSTKSDETPLNQVSMIQTVFERMATYAEDTSATKTLLTKCVMQFGRERQLHAQQAATYVRDLGDTWQSHSTLPMLSGRLLLCVASLYGPIRSPTEPADQTLASAPTDPTTLDTVSVGANPGVETADLNSSPAATEQATSRTMGAETSHEADELEDLEDDEFYLPLSSAGVAHQVDDYMHRGETLSHLPFYDFVRFCRMVNLPKRPNKNHHMMRATHPNVNEKCHRYTPKKANGIPRAIFSTFPRPNGTPGHGDSYCAAMLAHFIPFGVATPLKTRDESYETVFSTAPFPPEAAKIMENWEALTECEDARDADQLLRRKREASRAEQHDEAGDRLNANGEGGIDSATADVSMASMLQTSNRPSLETLLTMSTLSAAGWFKQSTTPRAQAVTTGREAENLHHHEGAPTFSAPRRRQWVTDMSNLEDALKASMAAPQTLTGVLGESLGIFGGQTAPETTSGEDFVMNQVAPETERVNQVDRPPHEIIDLLVEERGLTPSQRLAFSIAARHFYEELYGVPTEPLRLFMHGEAGTGKTVVVRLLRQLLERYGKGKQILFMAPTGKAACAIGGSTQHSTFAIDLHKRGVLSEELGGQQREQVSSRRIRYLQNTFANVRWLFFDEVSMTSCEILAEIDQALRIGRQDFDTPFGGMNVLFAGDLCQLPPVRSAALYSDVTSRAGTADAQTMVKLGRAVWQKIDTVVNFTEQMRMQDADMAAVLSRLRLRKCTLADADLLNQRALRCRECPTGLELSDDTDAIVLTRTNETVRSLNHQRATQYASNSGTDFVVSSAHDKTVAPMTSERRQALLNYNGTAKSKVGLGRIPLFKGMPVVYRGPNQSVALGVTNGAFATVVGWELKPDAWGCLTPKGVVLKFSDEASWALTELPSGCLPILPTGSTFKFAPTEAGGSVEKVQRQQIPLQPGFAMTVHSAQGITARGGIIVDLHRGGFEAYVAASRATRKEDIFLLRPITAQRLNNPPLPRSLRLELQRLDNIAETTSRIHNNTTWRVGSRQVSAQRNPPPSQQTSSHLSQTEEQRPATTLPESSAAGPPQKRIRLETDSPEARSPSS